MQRRSQRGALRLAVLLAAGTGALAIAGQQGDPSAKPLPAAGAAHDSLTIGAVIAFTLGRTVLRGWVQAQIAKNQTLQIVDRVVGQEGLKLMVLLRLSGIAPFVLTNYAMGVTSVTLGQFLLAMLGMIPTIATYAALGQAGAETPGAGTIPAWMLWMGVSAAIALAVTVTRIVQKALREAQMRHDVEQLAHSAESTEGE